MVDWDRVLAATDGTTPAMIKEIVKRAAVNALERDGHGIEASALAIDESDLLLAAEQVRRCATRSGCRGGLGFAKRRCNTAGASCCALCGPQDDFLLRTTPQASSFFTQA